MKAAVFHGAGQAMTIEDVEIDKPKGREVLIRTAVAGLCHSDLHFIEGKYPTPAPAVLGHESSGIVEAVGDQVTQFKPGDHVVTCLSVFCGHCEYCSTGYLSLCSTTDVKMLPGVAKRMRWKGQHLNQYLNLSSFAEQMLVHENAVVKIRPDMPLDLAALLGCGVLTGYGSVAHTAKVEPGSTVAVFGCGGIGLSTINAAHLAGAGRIIAIDTNPGKFDLARTFGATDCVNPKDHDKPIQQVIVDMTGWGVDHSFECIGNTNVMRAALECAHRGWGQSVIIGVAGAGQEISTRPFQLVTGRRWLGTAFGGVKGRSELPGMVDDAMAGRIALAPFVTHTMGLSGINHAFDLMHQGESIRSVVHFEGGE